MTPDDLERRLAATLRHKAEGIEGSDTAWESFSAAAASPRIRVLAGDPDRRRLAGVAAAVVGLAAAVALVVGVQRTPSPRHQLAAGAPVAPAQTQAPEVALPSRSAPTASAPQVAAGQGPQAAPGAMAARPVGHVEGFEPLSATFVSVSEGWVLGTAACPAGRCPSLVHTLDGGRSWSPVAAPGASERNVRFADHLDGWAFGPDLWVTHDGAASWRPVSLPGLDPGAQVSALEAGAGAVHAAVVDVGTAGPAFRIETSPVAADRWSLAPVAVPAGAGPVPHAQLVLQGSSGWMLGVNRTVTGGARLVSGAWQRWTPPCVDAVGPAVLAASSPVELTAGCDTGAWGGARRSEDEVVSHDGGDSYVASGTVPLRAIDAIAAPVTGQAVAAGPAADGAATLVATADGGASWHVALRRSGGTWSQLGFTTASQGFAVLSIDSGGSSLFVTRDGGASWAAASF